MTIITKNSSVSAKGSELGSLISKVFEPDFVDDDFITNENPPSRLSGEGPWDLRHDYNDRSSARIYKLTQRQNSLRCIRRILLQESSPTYFVSLEDMIILFLAQRFEKQGTEACLSELTETLNYNLGQMNYMIRYVHESEVYQIIIDLFKVDGKGKHFVYHNDLTNDDIVEMVLVQIVPFGTSKSDEEKKPTPF